MHEIDIQDIGNIKKLEVPIDRIQVKVGNFTLTILDTMAFWRSLSFIEQNYELEKDIFLGRDRITQAIDHYNKVTGAWK